MDEHMPSFSSMSLVPHATTSASLPVLLSIICKWFNHTNQKWKWAFIKHALHSWLTMWRLRTCCREVGRCHWNWYWELGCGEWGLVGSLILKTRPGISAFRPLIKERSERLTFMFQRFPRGEIIIEKWILSIIILQYGAITRCWCRKWGNSGWHHRPCTVQWRVHVETPVASWSIREKTMLTHIRFKSWKIPGEQKGVNHRY